MRHLIFCLAFFVLSADLASGQIKTDHRKYQSAIKNQQGRGTCTAFSICAVLETLPGFPSDVSEQHIYAAIKMTNMNKMPEYTEGALLAFYLDQVVKRGVFPEEAYPYNPKAPEWTASESDFEKLKKDLAGTDVYDLLTFKPAPFRVIKNNFIYKSETEARDVEAIKKALDSGTKAIAVGYLTDGNYWGEHKGIRSAKMDPADLIQIRKDGKVYDFKTANLMISNLGKKIRQPGSGIKWLIKNPTRYPFEEGHAVAIVGYDESGFLIKNSWSEAWGDKGYGWVSFDYHRMFADEILYANTLLWGLKVSEIGVKAVPENKKIYLKSMPYENKLTGETGIELSLVYHGDGEMPDLKTFTVKAFDSNNVLTEEKPFFFCNQGTKAKGYNLTMLKGKFPFFRGASKIEIRFTPEVGEPFTNVYENITAVNKEYAPKSNLTDLLNR